MILTRKVWLGLSAVVVGAFAWLVQPASLDEAIPTTSSPLTQKQTQLVWLVMEQDLPINTARAAWDFVLRASFGKPLLLPRPRLLFSCQRSDGSLVGWLVGSLPEHTWIPRYRERGAYPFGLLRLQVSPWETVWLGSTRPDAMRRGWVVQLLQPLEIPVARLLKRERAIV